MYSVIEESASNAAVEEGGIEALCFVGRGRGCHSGDDGSKFLGG